MIRYLTRVSVVSQASEAKGSAEREVATVGSFAKQVLNY